MERYTIRRGHGCHVRCTVIKYNDKFEVAGYAEQSFTGKHIDKLADYEDIGLEPQEIKKLIEQHDALKELARDLNDDLTLNIQEHAACMCDYCAKKEACVEKRQLGMCNGKDFVWCRHNELARVIDEA